MSLLSTYAYYLAELKYSGMEEPNAASRVRALAPLRIDLSTAWTVACIYLRKPTHFATILKLPARQYGDQIPIRYSHTPYI
jgi:hypothetical protein